MIRSPLAIKMRSAGVEVFYEGLRSVIVLHERLRPVGMFHDGPRPFVRDILTTTGDRPRKA